MWWICLKCGRRFYALNPRQCSQCWTHNIYPEEELLDIEEASLQKMKDTLLGAIPLYDIVVSVLASEGITLTPARKIALISKIHGDIVPVVRQRIAQGMSFNEACDSIIKEIKQKREMIKKRTRISIE
ncbi:MAG: hypothetical protein ACP5IM_05775 [Candidatus Bathyarchaeia archaeon]|nr:MAG: hypothetical protein C0193_02450 [Candidatus Bathyarchaeota archaeon]